MITPTELVAQFRDYGIEAIVLPPGVPMIPAAAMPTPAIARSVLLMIEGLRLGVDMFAEGWIVRPAGGARLVAHRSPASLP